MRGLHAAAVVLAVVALVLLLVFPPWMCIDPRSGGRVHAALGHAPLWNPPSPVSAFRTLYPDARELPGPDRLADFAPAVNRVRLTASALAVALVFVALRVLPLRARRS